VPDVVERFNKYGFRGSKQAVQMIWGGAFDRFPKLDIYVAEVQIGWVPNWMDQMDNEYGRQRSASPGRRKHRCRWHRWCATLPTVTSKCPYIPPPSATGASAVIFRWAIR
jgi:hypothetical protein